MMLITTCISVLAAIFACYYAMRYNLHMFQLNGYKMNEQIRWIQKNIKKQAVLLLSGIMSVLLFFLNSVAAVIITVVIWLIIISYYRYLKKANTKKPLKFTNRVKRMILTYSILILAICGLVWFFADYSYLTCIFAVVIFVQPLLILSANTVNLPIEKAVNKYYIYDAKKKLSEIDNLKIIGITGSYGKTSIKFYLKALLQEKYNVTATPGNFNTTMGVVRTIREFLKPTDQIFLCEMGARYVGDIKEICDLVHPDFGIISSIGAQHLETFKSIDNIIKTKFELADSLPDSGLLFLNGDNDYIVGNSGKYHNSVFYRNKTDGAGYKVENITLSQLGSEFDVISPTGEKERFQTKLIGEHNVINILGAIAVANCLGISLEELKIPVRKLQAVEHRMQMIEQGNVTIIDDAYNSNPAGSKAAVETLSMFRGVRILITPGMVELGKDEDKYNYDFGTYATKACDYILLVGKKHTAPIKNGALDSGFDPKKCVSFDDLNSAIKYAYNLKESLHKYILLENDLPDNY